jgi:hypothetical protein
MTQSSARKELASAMAAGAAMGRITHSRLMSPQQLERVSRERPELKAQLEGSWCLCTEVPGGMWQLALAAHAAGVPNQVMVARAQSGRPYIVFTINAAGWRHRVCVPMLGALTAQWLGSLREGGTMMMSVADAASDRTFLATSEVPLAAIEHLMECEPVPPVDLVGFLEEAFTLVAWNAAASTSVDGEMPAMPSEVSVSLLLPAEVEAVLEQLTERRFGRKPS